MAIARVQSKAANTGASAAASLNLVLDAAPTNGGVLILVVSTSTATAVSVPTSANVSWFGGAKNLTTTSMVAIFIGYVRTASASATIAITLSTGSQPIAAACAEYSGFSHAQLDTSSSNGATTGTTVTSGATPTTRSANELWITGVGVRCNSTLTFSSPINSFSIVANTSTTIGGANADRSVALLERIVTSTGTANGGVTTSQSNAWVAYTITFDDAGEGTVELIGSGGFLLT